MAFTIWKASYLDGAEERTLREAGYYTTEQAAKAAVKGRNTYGGDGLTHPVTVNGLIAEGADRVHAGARRKNPHSLHGGDQARAEERERCAAKAGELVRGLMNCTGPGMATATANEVAANPRPRRRA